MKQEVKASILVITYNQVDRIERAINSLLRQECSYKWEIILADDASTDGTRRVCERFAADYPELIRIMPYAKNKGLVGNYFDAFEIARGEYISDCAGDDEWLDPKRLQRQIEFLDSHPECSVCFCDVEVYKDGERVGLHSQDKSRNGYFKEHVEGYALLTGVLNNTVSLPYTLSAALYRKDAVMSIYIKHREMLRNEKGGIEDVPLIAALGATGDGGYLPITGYRYYIEGESISNNLSYEKEYRFYSGVLRLVRKLAEFYKVPLSELKDHYQSKISHIAAQARHANAPELIEDIKAISADWSMPIPLRGRIHLLLLSLQRKKPGV
ncbi:MAG: glycosyltransferase [Muribaculaceae bacterium]|nr:glycosyltransferase [Muribaculaceae bacterium]